jgi:hypothetical protein
MQHNDNRVLMAHSRFEPAENEGVQFRRTTASQGKVAVLDPIWTKVQFEDAAAKLSRIREALNGLKPRLTYKVAEGRSEIFLNYLYAPAANWVPSGD